MPATRLSGGGGRACLDHARRSGDAAHTRAARSAAAALADAIADQLDPSDAPAWALHREILGV